MPRIAVDGTQSSLKLFVRSGRDEALSAPPKLKDYTSLDAVSHHPKTRWLPYGLSLPALKSISECLKLEECDFRFDESTRNCESTYSPKIPISRKTPVMHVTHVGLESLNLRHAVSPTGYRRTTSGPQTC